MLLDAAIVAIVAALGELVAHWFRWERLVGRKLHPVANYVIGVLLFSGPYVGWLIVRRDWLHLSVYATAVIAAGLAVMVGYAIDAYLDARERATDLDAQVKLLDDTDD